MIYAIVGGIITGASVDSPGLGCAAFLLLFALDEIHDELVKLNRRQGGAEVMIVYHYHATWQTEVGVNNHGDGLVEVSEPVSTHEKLQELREWIFRKVSAAGHSVPDDFRKITIQSLTVVANGWKP